MNRVAFLGLLLLLCVDGWGCSAAGDDGPVIVAPLVLSPVAELADATEDAAEAWSAAAGIEVLVGTGGVPVVLDEEMRACGNTTSLRYTDGRLLRIKSIQVSAGDRADCMGWPGTLRHELGHALQHWASQVRRPSNPDGHTEDGLMAAEAGAVHTVDASALELICNTAPCAAFAPESQ